MNKMFLKIFLKKNNLRNGQRMGNMYIIGVHNKGNENSDNKYIRVNLKKIFQKEKKNLLI